jgi:EAL domain-containing protein (putative c-di-GMP-specific phosphodiesterase class I)
MFDVAERADLIFPLDRMARTTAVRNAAAHRVTGHIFINFTPAAVYDPGYCLRTTVQAVEEAGLERSRVVFEVIETERIGDPDHLANVLRFYREAGFKVALDDVGGGYSCLGLVARLKPDFIKLDRSLIDGVSGHPEQAAVVRHLFALARDLDIRTVAEGLERPEDLAWVREHGADFVQGFLTGRPAPEPVAAVLTRRFG